MCICRMIFIRIVQCVGIYYTSVHSFRTVIKRGNRGQLTWVAEFKGWTSFVNK